MMDFYRSSAGLDIPIIDVDHPTAEQKDALHPKGASYGYVERDFSIYPEPMFAPPGDMELVPESEWDARYDEQEATKSSLEHIYLGGPNGEPVFNFMDQDGFPDCWAHSTGNSMMLDRAKRNLPAIRFNGVAVATMLNQTSGGWCGLSAKFAREHGFPILGTASGEWPEHTRNKKYDTPELRARMARFKLEEEWTDMTRQVYDQNMTRAQVASEGFNNNPGPRDYSFWAHSVAGVRWVRVERGSWGQLILNSWKGWGRHGLGVLRGSQAICNGGLGVRLTSSSAL